MGKVVALGLVLGSLAIPRSLAAEPYSVLADGSLVFNTSLTTSGTFLCGALTPCTGATTNRVTFGSGATAVTITFTGVSSSFAVGNTTAPVTLGSFSVSTADAAFSFPAASNPNVSVVEFVLSLTHTSPVESSDARRFGFGPGGGGDLPLLIGSGDYFALPAGPNPPGFGYTALVYTISPFPFSIRGTGVTQLVADVGAVPEPASLLLVATGLGMAARLRRQRARR